MELGFNRLEFVCVWSYLCVCGLIAPFGEFSFSFEDSQNVQNIGQENSGN